MERANNDSAASPTTAAAAGPVAFVPRHCPGGEPEPSAFHGGPPAPPPKLYGCPPRLCRPRHQSGPPQFTQEKHAPPTELSKAPRRCESDYMETTVVQALLLNHHDKRTSIAWARSAPRPWSGGKQARVDGHVGYRPGPRIVFYVKLVENSYDWPLLMRLLWTLQRQVSSSIMVC